ncbi:hypothetical protein C8A01DRAFT_14717 [Parachaetomium inaequale]|uniref:Uncharacterized protein n=1 Tax=Parachaetomium inaequale TaxID=2588326 RepID=A0AAN6PIN4_9PEZI|nr:hypothetical protein C8A01DRAFT_14717 [Parachaetomium inaequale]
MSVVHNRRPPLATSVSAPDVFCRPMDPAPAPLVYINGWHGIGKETVAECLTLLLGKDKSLLIDVRSVGRETAPNNTCCGGGGSRVSKHKHHHRHEHNPLLTPEHPRYFSFDLDSDAYHFSPLPSPSSSPSFSSAFSPPTSRSASFSSDSTTATTISTSSTAPATTTTNLTALLTHPRNRARIAVLPACCPDTPAGHATLGIFEAAAARAGRLFVGVVLRCEEGVYLRRRRAEDGAAGGGGMGAGVCCAQGQSQSQDLGLARPVKAGLTVDVTCVPAFEAALQIVEFVKGLEAERDAELCSSGGSAATTPAQESERKLEPSGLAEGK